MIIHSSEVLIHFTYKGLFGSQTKCFKFYIVLVVLPLFYLVGYLIYILVGRGRVETIPI